MRERPDLTYPLLPDAADLDPPRHALPVDHTRAATAGTSGLQSSSGGDDFEWPEAGPSRLPADGSVPVGDMPQARLGPYGAKMVAAMTGATTTSLLMTPFDVLKTRLQTVQPHPKTPWIPPPPADSCCQTSLLTSASSSSSSARPTASNPLTCITAAPSSSFTASGPGSSAPGSLSAARSAFSSLRPATAPAAPPTGCAFPSKWAGIWGEAVTLEEAIARGIAGYGNSAGGSAGSGAATATLVLPQEGVWGARMGGFWAEVAAIRKDAGIRGLWKGVGTTLTMSIPSSAIYMIGYEHLLSIISPVFTKSDDPRASLSALDPRSTTLQQNNSRDGGIAASLTPAPLLAGSAARTFSATVISPIEMFRTRLMALPTAEHGTPTYASTTKDLAALVKSKGVTILWRGLGPTLWRDVPFSGLYWAGFEILKSHLSSSHSTLPPMTPIATSFVSGALSGTFAALLTQPFDVLKTRRQVFTPSPGCSPEALRHRASTLPLALHVIKTEGWGALFAGTVPRCGKVAPACGLMIACYEGVGRWLGGQQQA